MDSRSLTAQDGIALCLHCEEKYLISCPFAYPPLAGISG